LSETLPKIKKGFLQQGHQFALDKLNERSRSVLDKGLQRLAKGALGASGDNDIQAHDDAAFDLINKYVMSEAKFDENDANAMYDKYLSYAGVDLEKARASENEEVPGAKPGFKMEDAEMYAENDTGTVSDAGGKEETEAQGPKIAGKGNTEEKSENKQRTKEAGADHDVKPKAWSTEHSAYVAKKYVGSDAWAKFKSKDDFGWGKTKCNKFAYDVLKENGTPVPLIHEGNNPLSNDMYPPVAADWANKDMELDGWVVVDDPKPGDVAASSEHVGIVSGDGKTVSASSIKNKVVENDWGFREGQAGEITYRRYVGKTGNQR